MTNLGLSVSDVVNIQVLLTPPAAQQASFGSLLIVGDSGVIDTTQRMRLYTNLTGVAADFGTTAPEYQAAALFFGQSPQPQQLYIGAWARAGAGGTLAGAVLSSAQAALANFTSVIAGAITLSIDGTAQTFSALNFATAGNLNAVAAILQTAMGGIASVTWDSVNQRFWIKSATSGATSAVSFTTAPGAGTDVGPVFGFSATSGGYLSAGVAAETPLAVAQIFANLSNSWYGLMFAASAKPTDADKIAIAAYIQGTTVPHIYGASTQDPATLDSTVTTDLASQLKALGYNRTFVQYSSSNQYSAAGIFGKAFPVNFQGQNTTLTLKFKQEAGLVGENLSETQAATLTAKNCNVFVNYNNATAILQQGVMASGAFFDTIHGTDWLQNYIQTAVYNLLYASTTKIPQTDSGVNQIVTTLSACLDQAVTNGLVAPGVWTGPAFGALLTGQTLSTGYYVFAPPIATQSVADRSARKSPVITAAIKLAGAIHSVNAILSVAA